MAQDESVIRSKRSLEVGIGAAHGERLADALLAQLGVDTAQRLLQRLFVHVDRAVFLLDPEGTIVFASDRVSEMFGYFPNELEGARLSRLLGRPGDRQQPETPSAPILTDRQLCVYRRVDGSEFTGEAIRSPLRAASGEVVGSLLIVADVSDLVAGEALLRSLHEVSFDRDPDIQRRLRKLLRLATDHFRLPLAALVRDEGKDGCSLVQAIGTHLEPGARLTPGGLDTEPRLRWRTVAKHRLRPGFLDHEPRFADMPITSLLSSPVHTEGEPYGALLLMSTYERRPFSDQDRELIGVTAAWVGREIARHRDHQKLEEMATTDSLTGVANRRAIELALEDEMIRFARSGRPAAILLLDLDHFKEINDTYGHALGDDALCEFTDAVTEALRAGDRLGRWGGDEFLVVLPDTDAEGAWEVADRLQEAIRDVQVHHGQHAIPVRASIGVAVTRLGDSPNRLLRRADAAVYRMKASGRDGIALHDSRRTAE